MKNIHVLLFYKFLDVKNTEKFRKEVLKICEKAGVKGRILVASEGINGSVSGTSKQVSNYIMEMRKDPRFSDIIFKEELADDHPFKKIDVKIKKEIVTFRKKVDVNKGGKYIKPKEFLDLYENDKDVLILDTRNNYEHRIGKFKNAMVFDIKTFRDFPKIVNKLKDKKDKKIVMYCTGGIRCEKASAYMIKKGFKDVSQLEGGILTFCKEFPNTVWNGKLFVFDKRLVSDVNGSGQTITKCEDCGKEYDHYMNCRYTLCDKFTILCPDCRKTLKGCCSSGCLEKFENACRQKAQKNQGKSRKIIATTRKLF